MKLGGNGIYVYMAISSLTDFNFESFISEKGLQVAYFSEWCFYTRLLLLTYLCLFLQSALIENFLL